MAENRPELILGHLEFLQVFGGFSFRLADALDQTAEFLHDAIQMY